MIRIAAIGSFAQTGEVFTLFFTRWLLFLLRFPQTMGLANI